MRLRPATAQDADLLLAWRNDPFVIAHGSSQRAVIPAEHHAWFAETLAAPERRRLYVIESAGEGIGQVRFDALDAANCTISAYVLEKFVGRGLGTEAMLRGCLEIRRCWPQRRVFACVRLDNPRIHASLRKAGFTEVPSSRRCPDAHIEFIFPAQPVPHNRLQFGDDAAREVAAVVSSGWVAGGPRMRELEASLAKLAGRKHALCVGSGLAALRLALRAQGIGPGHEVVVPAYSCVALPNAVLALGAVPVPADVSSGEWNLDPHAVSRVLTAKTRAVIAVHTFGVVARIAEFKRTGITLVEDCAHALGAGHLGALGDAAISSFYATKLIGGGEGGVVLTDDENVARRVIEARDYGDQPADGGKLNDKMNDMEAALALAQVRQLPALLAEREALARAYHDALQPLAAQSGRFKLPAAAAGRIWYRYAIEMNGPAAAEVIEALKEYGVDAQMPVFDWRAAESRGRCPVADRAYRSLVSLPLYPGLSAAEQWRICLALSAVLQ